MIVIENLTKKYNNKVAINNISLNIDCGKIVGLLGPNGAGKSSLMKIITCMSKPIQGDVMIDGLDIYNDSEEIQKKIGFLPENCPLYYDMTIREFLKYMGDIRYIGSAKLNNQISMLIDSLDLGDYYDVIISKLSKGLKQRVGICQALIHDPSIVILDEPVVGLDPVQIVKFRKLLKSFVNKDKIILMSSHILQEISKTCDNIIIMSSGNIVAQGTESKLMEIFSKDKSKVLKLNIKLSSIENLTHEQVLDKISSVSSIVKAEYLGEGLKFYIEAKHEDRNILLKSLEAKQLSINEFKFHNNSLEDLYMEIVK